MITQRPSSLHTRDREIAAMPLAVDHAGERWLVSLLLWLAMVGVFVVVALIFA